MDTNDIVEENQAIIDIVKDDGKSEQNKQILENSTINSVNKTIKKKGINTWFVIAIIFLINILWVLGVQYFIKPSYTGTINEQNSAMQKQNEYLTQIQTDYTNNLQNLQKQIDAANLKITELQNSIK